jgi:hypothetical protein
MLAPVFVYSLGGKVSRNTFESDYTNSYQIIECKMYQRHS